jgi:predicted RNA-binding protein
MCEAALIAKNGNIEEEIMREIEVIVIEGNNIKASDILGREMDVEGSITRIDLIQNKIYFERKV